MYELDATADVLLMRPQATAATQQLNETAIEAVLVSAALAGDRDGFGQLYDLYAPLVHGILLARVPRGEVDDLVQDIFLHAYKKLDTLRDKAAFGPWIAMIARNRAVDFYRRTRETVDSLRRPLFYRRMSIALCVPIVLGSRFSARSSENSAVFHEACRAGHRPGRNSQKNPRCNFLRASVYIRQELPWAANSAGNACVGQESRARAVAHALPRNHKAVN